MEWRKKIILMSWPIILLAVGISLFCFLNSRSSFRALPHPTGVIIGDSADASPELRQLQADFAQIILQNTSLDLYLPVVAAPDDPDHATPPPPLPNWMEHSRVHQKPCQGLACLWPRDWGILVQGGGPFTFWQLTPQEIPRWQPGEKFQPRKMPAIWPRGDLGGNLLPLGLGQLMAGEEISSELWEKVRSKFSLQEHEYLIAHTSWTMIGHLDELFALAFYAPPGTRDYEYYLFYADPRGGLDLLAAMPAAERLALLQSGREEEQREGGIDLGAQMANEQRQDFSAAVDLNHRHYAFLAAANKTYAKLIEQDLEKLKKQFDETHTIKVPILFLPAYLQNAYGSSHDLAVAAHANSVNFWAGDNIIITAAWPWPTWQQAIEQQMNKFPGKTFYLDTTILNRRRGGLHCFTNEVATESNEAWFAHHQITPTPEK